MATKKQRREAAERKHQEFMAEYRRTGLEAQRKDRLNRAREERKKWQKQHDTKHNWKNRVKECPLCREFMKVDTSQAAG